MVKNCKVRSRKERLKRKIYQSVQMELARGLANVSQARRGRQKQKRVKLFETGVVSFGTFTQAGRAKVPFVVAQLLSTSRARRARKSVATDGFVAATLRSSSGSRSIA